MEKHDHMVDAMRYAFEARASHDPHYRHFHARFSRWWRKFLRASRGLYHTIFWRTLFALGIGWTVGKIMCRLNIYEKRGPKEYKVCSYCGNKH